MNLDRAIVQRAATILEQEAARIKMCHTLAGGQWPDQYRKAKADHDEYVAIAAELRRTDG